MDSETMRAMQRTMSRVAAPLSQAAKSDLDRQIEASVTWRKVQAMLDDRSMASIVRDIRTSTGERVPHRLQEPLDDEQLRRMSPLKFDVDDDALGAAATNAALMALYDDERDGHVPVGDIKEAVRGLLARGWGDALLSEWSAGTRLCRW